MSGYVLMGLCHKYFVSGRRVRYVKKLLSLIEAIYTNYALYTFHIHSFKTDKTL
jgi:hypothetical protein